MAESAADGEQDLLSQGRQGVRLRDLIGGEQGALSEAGKIILAGRDQAGEAATLTAGGEDALARLGVLPTDALILGRPDVLPLLEGMNKAAEVDLAARGLLDQPMVSPELLAKWLPPLSPEDKDRLLGTALHSLFPDGDRLSAGLHQFTDLTASSMAGALLPDLGARLEDIRIGLRDWGNAQAVQMGEALRASMDSSIFGLGEQARNTLARMGETFALTNSHTLHNLAAATQLYRDQMQQAAGLLGSVASSQEMNKNALGALGTVGAASQITAPAYDLAGAALWRHDTLLGDLDRSLSGAFAFERWAGNDLADLLAGLPPAPGRWPPAVISRRPEPGPEPKPTALEPVQLAGQWSEVLAHALTAGIASPKEMIEFVLALAQQHAPGVKQPTWAEVQAVALAYKERGHRFTDQAAFARSIGYSRATVQRCLKLYEVATGEQVRPGRGRGRRKLM